MAAAIAVAATLLIAQGAAASTITVGNLENENLPNIEAHGRMTFRYTGFGEIEVICNKTIRGRLFRSAAGELLLGSNNAGFVNEVRLANCTGSGTAEATLVELGNEVQNNTTRLSWTHVTEHIESQMAGLDARVSVEIPSFATTCLDTVLIRIRSIAETNGRYVTLELELVRILSARVVRGLTCPGTGEVRMIGTDTITRPAGGVTLRLG
jgi:hypothetical protein